MSKPFILPIGQFFHGKTNSLCDVAGVKVGMTTHLGAQGISTGVTAILPSTKIYAECFEAGSFVLNGAGEMTGLHQLNEWGKLETPILLTNTHGVGVAYSASVKWLMKKYPRIGRDWPVAIPVVGECDDSSFHNIRKSLISESDVLKALNGAKEKFVQGNSGGGTGLSSCGLKSGTGSSSRLIELDGKKYTLGVLLQSNCGTSQDLRFLGKSLREWNVSVPKNERKQEGSLICVLATDAPLRSIQLSRLAKRAALGIARAGTTARHGSGEFFVAFSTTSKWKRSTQKDCPFIGVNQNTELLDSQLNILFEAACDTAEEAFYCSLLHSNGRRDLNGKHSAHLIFDPKHNTLSI